jgi:hypothetical protein
VRYKDLAKQSGKSAQAVGVFALRQFLHCANIKIGIGMFNLQRNVLAEGFGSAALPAAHPLTGKSNSRPLGGFGNINEISEIRGVCSALADRASPIREISCSMRKII